MRSHPEENPTSEVDVDRVYAKMQSVPERAFGTLEPRREKTGLRGFRPGPTQTRLCNYTRWLEA